MEDEDWIEGRWSVVLTRITDVRRRLASGGIADVSEMRADIANVLHAASNLFELEVRQMARRP